MESKLIQARTCKFLDPFKFEWNGCVEVNVMFLSEGLLQLFDGFNRTFWVKHRISTGDTCSSCFHSMTFFDDFLPCGTSSFVCEHIRRFASIFRERTIIATPMALASHKEDQFTSFLTLNTTFCFTLLRRQNLRVHWKMDDHEQTPVHSLFNPSVKAQRFRSVTMHGNDGRWSVLDGTSLHILIHLVHLLFHHPIGQQPHSQCHRIRNEVHG